MKPRNDESERLEADYLARLKRTLAGKEESEASEIVQSVREHIEEALAEFDSEEVTLVQMANVLERLGPPESYAEEKIVEQGPPAAQAVPAAPQAITCEERERFVSLLDKVWWGYLIAAIGLYIPFIDFRFCDLIGCLILAYVLLNYRSVLSEAFNSAGKLAVIMAILMLVEVPLNIIQLSYPAIGILGLTIILAWVACWVILYWKVLDGTAVVLQRGGNTTLARYVRNVRVYYVIAVAGLFFLGLIVGIIAVLAGGVRHVAVELWWLGLCLLPLGWVIDWFFILRPVGMARDALRHGTREPGPLPAAQTNPCGTEPISAQTGSEKSRTFWLFIAIAVGVALICLILVVCLLLAWYTGGRTSESMSSSSPEVPVTTPVEGRSEADLQDTIINDQPADLHANAAKCRQALFCSHICSRCRRNSGPSGLSGIDRRADSIRGWESKRIPGIKRRSSKR